jgi:diacylglycerol kinase (ATP)
VELEASQLKRAVILYNPIARGLARHPHLFEGAIGVLARQGISARLVPTEAAGTAGAQARSEIANGCDLVIAAGGDGTINEVANGMLKTDVPLAILPGGTANVLAREMRIPIHMERAAAEMSRMRLRKISAGSLRLGSADPRCFLCMAGAGLDAEIVSRLNPEFKARTGKFAYYVTGFAQVFRPIREFSVSIDGKRYAASFALISRVRNYGGDLEIARNASLLRDDFEVVLFRGTISLRYLHYLLGVALKQAHRIPGCTFVRGRYVECLAPSDGSIYVQVDGELAGRLPITAEILPGALTMMVSPEYVSREQSLIAAA